MHCQIVFLETIFMSLTDLWYVSDFILCVCSFVIIACSEFYIGKIFFRGQSTKAFSPPPLGLVGKRMDTNSKKNI